MPIYKYISEVQISIQIHTHIHPLIYLLTYLPITYHLSIWRNPKCRNFRWIELSCWYSIHWTLSLSSCCSNVFFLIFSFNYILLSDIDAHFHRYIEFMSQWYMCLHRYMLLFGDYLYKFWWFLSFWFNIL